MIRIGYLVFVFFIVIANTNLKAQNKSDIGFHLGVNHATTYSLSEGGPPGWYGDFDNYHVNDYNNGKHNYSLMFGWSYNLKFAKSALGFSSELNFFRVNYTAFSSRLGDIKITRNDYVRQYLSVPLLLKWHMGSINIFSGPQVSYLYHDALNGNGGMVKMTLTDQSGQEIIAEQRVYRPFDLSGVFGIGIDNVKSRFYMNLRVVMSFSTILGSGYIDLLEDIPWTAPDGNTFTQEVNKKGLNRYIMGQFCIGFYPSWL